MAVNCLQFSQDGVIESPVSVPIPPTDLFSYIVSSGTALSRKSPQYFDATSPSSNYNLEDAERMAKRFGCGLQSIGLRKQQKVLLYSGNDLFFPVVLWGVTAAGGVFTGASPTASAHGMSNL
jgi:acyl-CoA synthetase (AMP-forming)/AMP-acid ligase II